MDSLKRVINYLDFLLVTYDLGVPTIKMTEGIRLQPAHIRALCTPANPDPSIEAFLDAHERSGGGDVIDIRPHERNPLHTLTVTDLRELVERARAMASAA